MKLQISTIAVLISSICQSTPIAPENKDDLSVHLPRIKRSYAPSSNEAPPVEDPAVGADPHQPVDILIVDPDGSFHEDTAFVNDENLIQEIHYFNGRIAAISEWKPDLHGGCFWVPGWEEWKATQGQDIDEPLEELQAFVELLDLQPVHMAEPNEEMEIAADDAVQVPAGHYVPLIDPNELPVLWS